MTPISFSKGACTYNREDLSTSKIYQEILLEDDSRKGFFIKRRGFSGLRYHLLWALQAPMSLENRCGLNMMVEQRNRGSECGDRNIHH